jgi:hypothetical protein
MKKFISSFVRKKLKLTLKSTWINKRVDKNNFLARIEVESLLKAFFWGNKSRANDGRTILKQNAHLE